MQPGVLGASYRQPHYWNPSTQTWYSSALGNQLAGYNVVPGMRDIRLEMSSNFNWFYGITGNPSSSQFDWITVMLHEITHGLGFSALVGSDGQYRYTTSGGSQQTHSSPGTFDRQLFQGTSGSNLTALNQSQRAALVVSNNLFSGRPNSHLLAANNGSRVRMYAPSTWRGGSSVSHWDVSVTFPTFMRPYASAGFRMTVINEREVAIMRDMGWGISVPCVNSFSNQTITTNRTVIGCQNLEVKNVTVTGGAHLRLDAPGTIRIEPGFRVEPGATLRIK